MLVKDVFFYLGPILMPNKPTNMFFLYYLNFLKNST